MKAIRMFTVLAALAFALFGQAAGTITVASTVTAVAGRPSSGTRFEIVFPPRSLGKRQRTRSLVRPRQAYAE